MPEPEVLTAIRDLLPRSRSGVLIVGAGSRGLGEALEGEHEIRVARIDEDLSGASFDVAVLVGALGSVDHSEAWLSRLLSTGVLRPKGSLIAWVPNASHHRRLGSMLVGEPVLGDDGSQPFTLPAVQRVLENGGFLLDRVLRIPGAVVSGDGLGRLIGELNAESEVASYVVRAVPDDSSARLAQDRARWDADREAWTVERDDLRRQLDRASRNLEAVSSLLSAERETFAAAVARGAKELELRDRRVRQLRQRRDVLISQRDAARIQVRRYRGSRAVRLTLRVVEKVRRLRGRA